MKGTRKGLLALNRRVGEAVDISGPCKVRVVELRGNQVRLSFEADRNVTIDREEITERKRREAGGEVNGNVDARKPCHCRAEKHCCAVASGAGLHADYYCAKRRAQGERG